MVIVRITSPDVRENAGSAIKYSYKFTFYNKSLVIAASYGAESTVKISPELKRMNKHIINSIQ